MDIQVNTIIVAANVILSLVAFGNPTLFSKMLFNPYQVTQRREYYRVITHAFIHASYIHLFFNMYVLYQFGGLIESIFTDANLFKSLFPGMEFWGKPRGYLYFIMLYFGGLIFATLPAIRKHANDPGYNSLGASGAVSAVVMAVILLLPTMSLRLFFIPINIPAFIIGFAYLGYEYYMSRRGGTRIAHDAHFYGAIFGLALLLIVKPAFGLRFLELIGQFLGI